jgi:hypothetical protein
MLLQLLVRHRLHQQHMLSKHQPKPVLPVLLRLLCQNLWYQPIPVLLLLLFHHHHQHQHVPVLPVPTTLKWPGAIEKN